MAPKETKNDNAFKINLFRAISPVKPLLAHNSVASEGDLLQYYVARNGRACNREDTMSGQETVGNLEVCLAQKENMEAIFHSVADGIVTVDTNLTVSNLNRASQKMLCAPPEEMVGRPIAEVFPCKLWDLIPLIEKTIQRREAMRERENILVCSDGRELRVLIGMSHLLDLAGDLAGAVIIIRDITYIREMETLLENRASLHSIIGKSHAMQEIYALIEQVGPTDSTVLILGESGTGKELVADAVHRSSCRQKGPFIKVNCSALSETLLESELFGHVRGAFTGASHDRKGRFELADGGTIFLDEIGDLSPGIQVKLLRVLQEREIERVGDTGTIRIDTRILTATHQPLSTLVEEGRFRQDLYYRLRVIPIHLPALRERKEDIPALAAAFLDQVADQIGKNVGRISPDALRSLMDYPWPGNVRELRNAIEHGIVKARGKIILVEDLPREIIEHTETRSEAPPGAGARESVQQRSEAESIREALEATAWNRGRAAALLGVDRTTLWRKMKRLDIKTP